MVGFESTESYCSSENGNLCAPTFLRGGMSCLRSHRYICDIAYTVVANHSEFVIVHCICRKLNISLVQLGKKGLYSMGKQEYCDVDC